MYKRSHMSLVIILLNVKLVYCVHGLVKQEAAALATAQFAFVVQSGQPTGVQFAMASATPSVPASTDSSSVPAPMDRV